jgi:hypothetical protein
MQSLQLQSVEIIADWISHALAREIDLGSVKDDSFGPWHKPNATLNPKEVAMVITFQNGRSIRLAVEEL